MTLRRGAQSFVAMDARLFPTELLHEIITLTLSRYLSDVLIAPTSTRSWDAIGTLLHVDYHFRSCALSVLNGLWDGNFVDHKTGCVFLRPLSRYSNSKVMESNKGIHETILTRSNIYVVLQNLHRPIQRTCFPQSAMCFLCARTQHRTSVSDATSLYTRRR
jgi:hypothetical protein